MGDDHENPELPESDEPLEELAADDLAGSVGAEEADPAAAELAAALESMDAFDESGDLGLIPGMPDALPEALPGEFSDAVDLGDSPFVADPALDVEQMLAAEVAPESPLEAMPAVEEGAAPTFQLQLEVRPEQRAALQAVAESLSLNLPEGNSPLLSQLTEYQAIAFRQLALALGAPAIASIRFPPPSLTEEDQALGDLAMVKEAELPLTEGAPSVTLPKNEREVMLLTETGANIQVRQTFGIVTAHRSIARRFFREDEAQEKLRKELERLPGGARGIPGSRLEGLLRELLLDLQKMVLQRGGNALFGLRLESFPETSHLDPELEQMRLVAFGTASIVEKSG